MLGSEEMYHGHGANSSVFWTGQDRAGSRSDGKNHRNGVFCTERRQLPWEDHTAKRLSEP